MTKDYKYMNSNVYEWLSVYDTHSCPHFGFMYNNSFFKCKIKMKQNENKKQYSYLSLYFHLRLKHTVSKTISI